MASELLPCPFCGESPAVVVHEQVMGASIFCPARDSDAVASSSTVAKAGEKWNRRAPSTVAAEARREALEEAAELFDRGADLNLSMAQQAKPVLTHADIAAAIRALKDRA
jgi:hypothetical protein